MFILYVYIIEQKHNMCNGKYRINTSIQTVQDYSAAARAHNSVTTWYGWSFKIIKKGRLLCSRLTPFFCNFMCTAGYILKNMREGSGSSRRGGG